MASTFVLRWVDRDRELDRYIRSRARAAIITGPLGSGKTWGSCLKLFLLMCGQQPNKHGVRRTRFFAVRNTYSDLKSTTIKEWKEFLQEDQECRMFGRFYQHGTLGPPTHVLNFHLPDKTRVQSEVVFVALDRPKDADKIRGSEVTAIWFNEVKLLPKLVIDQGLGRTGRFPPDNDGSGGATHYGIFGDTNSCDEDHWLYRLAEETDPEEVAEFGGEPWEFYRQPGAFVRELDSKGMWTGRWLANEDSENRENLKPDYYSMQMFGKSTEWIAVNIANEYGSVMDGRGIYREHWSDFMHLERELKATPGLPLVVGIDPGQNMAAVVTQMQEDGSVYVLDEVYASGAGIEGFMVNKLGSLLSSRYNGFEISYIIDPSAANGNAAINQSVVDLIAGFGIYCTTPDIPNNDLDIRLDAVRHFLSRLIGIKPALRVAKRCRLIVAGFNGGYQFKRVQVAGEDRFRDKPEKNKFSHPHDALQYAMLYHRGLFNTSSDGDYDGDSYDDEDEIYS